MARLINKRNLALYIENLTKKEKLSYPFQSIDRTNLGRNTANLKIYPVTIVNLLGRYGNFEVDSNGDGLADGWTAGSYVSQKELVSGVIGQKAQRFITTRLYNNVSYRITCSVNIEKKAGDAFFLSAWMKKGLDANYICLGWEGEHTGHFSTQSTSWEYKYRTWIAQTTGSGRIYCFALSGIDGGNNEGYLDGVMVVNLSLMGHLPPPLKEYFSNQVSLWSDLATTSNITAIDGKTKTGEEWLSELIPYVDSVKTVGYAWGV
jgi:hypothetical protein